MFCSETNHLLLFLYSYGQSCLYTSRVEHLLKRVYGQFCIEMLHESPNRNRTFSSLFVRISTLRSVYRFFSNVV